MEGRAVEAVLELEGVAVSMTRTDVEQSCTMILSRQLRMWGSEER